MVWILWALLFACSPSDDPDESPSTLEASGVVVCEEPEQRAELGPMALTELGPGWTEQVEEEEAEDFIHGYGIALGDIDANGQMDIVLVHRSRTQIWMGLADGGWEESTNRLSKPEERAEHQNWSTNVASLADVDGDGDLDLYLAFEKIPDQLYLNDGEGYFENQTEASGLSQETLGTRAIAWGDLDGDLDLDLVLGANGPEEEDFGDPNSILLNDGSGRFEDVSTLLTEEERIGYTQSIGVLDFDLDGHSDIYIINHRPEYGGNQLLFNDGALGLSADAESGAQLSIQGMGLGIGDLNDDALPDLLLADTFGLKLLLSSGPRRWAEGANALGLSIDLARGQHAAWSSHLEDMDNDGLLDAAAAFGPVKEDLLAKKRMEQPDELWLQQPDGQFLAAARDWGLDDLGNGHALALVDLNQDGYLDWLLNSRQEPAKAWLSRCGESSWLILRLRDHAPNTFAIGSRVEVEAGGQIYRRWLSSGSTGMALSHSTELHFGLGANQTIDRLRVTWPGGEVETWEDLLPRQVLQITR